MATIRFQIKNITAAEGTTATLVQIFGAIDTTSIDQFQRSLDELLGKGVPNLILDCANVQYISSTGLGALLKYVIAFEEEAGGHLSFIRVPPKIMLVMEMLGFNVLFDIHEDESGALTSIAGGIAALPEAPTPVAPLATLSAAGSASALAATQPFPAAVTPSTPVLVSALDLLPAVSFPLQVRCGRCCVTLEFQGSGDFKCPRCETKVQVASNGRVRFVASKKMKPVKLTLPTIPSVVEGIGPLLAAMAQQIGFNGQSAHDLAASVTGMCREVICATCGNDPTQIFHVNIVPEHQQLTVRLSGQGKPIRPVGGNLQSDPRFEQVLRTMDRVNLDAGAQGGNVIMMTKRVGQPGKNVPARNRGR